MEYEWNMNGVWWNMMEYDVIWWNMNGIWMEYECDIAWDMMEYDGIWMEYDGIIWLDLLKMGFPFPVP